MPCVCHRFCFSVQTAAFLHSPGRNAPSCFLKGKSAAILRVQERIVRCSFRQSDVDLLAAHVSIFDRKRTRSVCASRNVSCYTPLAERYSLPSGKTAMFIVSRCADGFCACKWRFSFSDRALTQSHARPRMHHALLSLVKRRLFSFFARMR